MNLLNRTFLEPTPPQKKDIHCKPWRERIAQRQAVEGLDGLRIAMVKAV